MSAPSPLRAAVARAAAFVAACLAAGLALRAAGEGLLLAFVPASGAP